MKRISNKGKAVFGMTMAGFIFSLMVLSIYPRQSRPADAVLTTQVKVLQTQIAAVRTQIAGAGGSAQATIVAAQATQIAAQATMIAAQATYVAAGSNAGVTSNTTLSAQATQVAAQATYVVAQYTAVVSTGLYMSAVSQASAAQTVLLSEAVTALNNINTKATTMLADLDWMTMTMNHPFNSGVTSVVGSIPISLTTPVTIAKVAGVYQDPFVRFNNGSASPVTFDLAEGATIRLNDFVLPPNSSRSFQLKGTQVNVDWVLTPANAVTAWAWSYEAHQRD